MSDERENERVLQTGRAENEKIEINSLWLDYHGTIAYRKAGALKRAAEKALGCKIIKNAEAINADIETIRTELDLQETSDEVDGPDKWIEINRRAFGCSVEEATRMSEYVRDERNYIVSPKRLKFVRWLLSRFPSRNRSGKFVLTASNADFTTVSRFVESHVLEGVRPVSGNLLGVYKPNICFSKRLIEATGVSPENTLSVANSWRNDLPAARLGVNVVIILPPSVSMSPDEIMKRVGEVKGRVVIVRSLMAARQAIIQNFVQIR